MSTARWSERLNSQLGIPGPIRELAALLYRKSVIKRLVRGRSIEGMVAAILYAACRIRMKPRSLDEIADVSRFDKKKLGYFDDHFNDPYLNPNPASTGYWPGLYTEATTNPFSAGTGPTSPGPSDGDIFIWIISGVGAVVLVVIGVIYLKKRK